MTPNTKVRMKYRDKHGNVCIVHGVYIGDTEHGKGVIVRGNDGAVYYIPKQFVIEMEEKE